MESNGKSRWAASLKLSDKDLQHFEKRSKLNEPLGFLVFLHKIGSVKAPKLGSSKECSLSLGCNLDASSNLPKSFKNNDEFKDELGKPVSLGCEETVKSIEEGRNKLWKREFPFNQNDISETKFIPKAFLEKIPDIPAEFKEPFLHRIIKHLISSCERISKLFPNNNQDSISMESLLTIMKWAQLLVDVWQLKNPEPEREEALWKQEDWLDTLTAPLFQYGTDSDTMWCKLQEHLKTESNPDIRTFLDKYQPANTEFHPEKAKRIGKQGENVKSQRKIETIHEKHHLARLGCGFQWTLPSN